MKFKLKPLLSLLSLILTVLLFSNDAHASNTITAATGAGAILSRMEQEAFDNFDGDMLTFDPETVMGYDDEDGYDVDDSYDLADGYSKPKAARRQKAMSALSQVDIVLDNTAISATTTIELFNYLRSNTTIRNTSYNASTFEPYVYDKTFLRATPASGQLLSDAQLIYWRSDGSLVYNTTTGAAAVAGAVACIISCTQVPYRVIHEATRNNALYISKFRLSVKTAPQIDQSFNYFKNSFIGGVTINNIAPRSEFKPNQFQSLIVDVPMNIVIDAERGLSYTLVSQEKVTITMFFKFKRGNEGAHS